MQLSSPKNITWWIAVILGVLGIISWIVKIPANNIIAFLLVAAGWVILVLGTYLKGL